MKNQTAKRVLQFIIGGALLCSTVFAASMQTDISVLPQTDGRQKLVVDVSRVKDGDELTIRALVPNTSLKLQDITKENVSRILLYADQKTVVDGGVRFAVNIPAETEEGEIALFICNANTEEKTEIPFSYDNQTTLNRVLEEIYANRDDDEKVFDAIKKYKDGLGIHSALYDTFEELDIVPKGAMKAITKKLYTVQNWKEYTGAMQTALVSDAINDIKSTETYQEILKKDTKISCVDALGLCSWSDEAEKRYEKFAKEENGIMASVVNTLMQRNDYTAESFSKAFHEAVFMVSLGKVENSDMIETLILENGDLLEHAATFSSLSDENRALAAAEIYESRGAGTLALFDQAVKTANANYSGSNGSSNSGFSGGVSGGVSGGGASGVYISPAETEKSEEPKAETVAQMEMPFTDMENASWAEEAVMVLHDMGVLNGRETDKFCPDDYVTREEFTKMAVVLFGYYSEDHACSFTDVTQDDWFYHYVASAQNIGVVNGVSETVFGSGENILREQLMAMVYRFVGLAGISLYDEAIYVPYDDDALISDYAREAIERMTAVGLINGDGNAVYPKNPCTRAEAAKILYQVYRLSISK